MAVVWEMEYKPENEHSEDMDRNKGKSVKEQGFHADTKKFYEPGDSERKDKYGYVVSHQDSKSFPTSRRGEDTF